MTQPNNLVQYQFNSEEINHSNHHNQVALWHWAEVPKEDFGRRDEQYNITPIYQSNELSILGDWTILIILECGLGN